MYNEILLIDVVHVYCMEKINATMKDLNYAVLENLTAAKRGIFLYHSGCIDNLDSMHMTVIYSQHLGSGQKCQDSESQAFAVHTPLK